jgi:hypothetical protein
MQLRLLLVSACLGTCLATAAVACPDHASKAAVLSKPRPASAAALLAWKPRTWTPPASVAAWAGLRVSIDPVDGALGMPESDELGTSSAAGDEDRRPVALTRRADGSVRAQLDDRWATHSVATIGPDGKLRWTCVDGKHAAERFLKTPVLPAATPVAPKWEEK